MSNSTEVTVLLREAERGSPQAVERLYSILYEDLRGRAHLILNSRAGGQTLQPTALVHEAWLKLVRQEDAAWNDRAHFLRVAARAMHSILVDHARARKAQKRQGEGARVELEGLFEIYEDRADLLALDDALQRLTGFDPELGKLVELRFFGGLTIEETARVLGVSESTVERSWRTARTWLKTQL